MFAHCLQASSSDAQLQEFNVQPRFARHTLVSWREVYRGVENVCLMMGRVLRCANNIDRSSCRYSSRRILQVPPCLHYSISMTHRTHATTGIKTSLTSVVRPSVAIPSDSMTSLSLVELHTTFKPLRSRTQCSSPTRRLQDLQQHIMTGVKSFKMKCYSIQFDSGVYEPFYQLMCYLSETPAG